MSILLTACLIFTTPLSAFADESFIFTDEATKLNKLGLYAGIDPNAYVPDLGGKLDRQTGVTLLLSLFGQQEEASAMSDAKADKILKEKFVDANQISALSKKPIAYAVEKGIVSGIPEGNGFRFDPESGLSGAQFAWLILNQLGYSDGITYEMSAKDLANKISDKTTFSDLDTKKMLAYMKSHPEFGLEGKSLGTDTVTAKQLYKIWLQQMGCKQELIKDDFVGASYGILYTRHELKNTIVASYLAEEGIVSPEKLKEVSKDLYDLSKVEVKLKSSDITQIPASTPTTSDNDNTDITPHIVSVARHLIYTYVNDTPNLPQQVVALYSDNTARRVTVSWQNTNILTSPGEHTINGIIESDSYNATMYVIAFDTVDVSSVIAYIVATSPNTLSIRLNNNYDFDYDFGSIDTSKIKFVETNGNSMTEIPQLQINNVTYTTVSGAVYGNLTLNNPLTSNLEYDGNDSDSEPSRIRLYFDKGALVLKGYLKTNALPSQNSYGIEPMFEQ